MEIQILNDRAEMGRAAADSAAALLHDAIRRNGSAAIVVATGSSQFEVLEHLVSRSDIDWPNIDGFHLDEYVGIASSHPASFCRFLQERFVSRVPIRSFHFLDGTQPPEAVCAAASEAIRKQEIDLAMIGIGENGHLAFNDPPADFQAEEPYRVVELDEACRRQQVGEGWFPDLSTVPKFAIFMSIRHILKSRWIICSVPDHRKAQAVERTLRAPIDPSTPASILRTHQNTILLLDRASASRITASS